LYVHGPDGAAQGLVIQLPGRPVLQGQRLVAHIVDPGPKRDALLVSSPAAAGGIALFAGSWRAGRNFAGKSRDSHGRSFQKTSSVGLRHSIILQFRFRLDTFDCT